MTRIALLLSTGAGSGYFPIAPGTVGSAVGLAVLVLVRLSGSAVVEIATILAMFVVGTWAADVTERHYGRADPGVVVIDEIMGMLITVALLPVSWAGALFGFVAFRVFDVIKPWPARSMEQLPGGLGVMSDDAMAGLYAHAVTQVACRLAPAWLAPAWMITS